MHFKVDSSRSTKPTKVPRNFHQNAKSMPVQAQKPRVKIFFRRLFAGNCGRWRNLFSKSDDFCQNGFHWEDCGLDVNLCKVGHLCPGQPACCSAARISRNSFGSLRILLGFELCRVFLGIILFVSLLLCGDRKR